MGLYLTLRQLHNYTATRLSAYAVLLSSIESALLLLTYTHVDLRFQQNDCITSEKELDLS